MIPSAKRTGLRRRLHVRARAASFLLGLALAVTLAGCGSGSSGPPAPAAPDGVTATASDQAVVVTWSEVLEATSYNVYWSQAAGAGLGGTAITGLSRPYLLHRLLANDTTYHYTVTAVGAGGESEASLEASATPQQIYLNTLTFGDTALTGCVGSAGPVDVGSLTLLNCNTGNGIAELSGIEALVNLTQLNLYGNTIADLSSLAGLTGLTTLNVGLNAITDPSPLAGLDGLTNLILSSNDITTIAPLAELSGLTVLGLDDNPLVDYEALSGFPGLTYLGLNASGVTDLSLLAGKADLEYLYAAFNGITDVSELGNHPALLEVGLGGNSITTGVPALAALVNATLIDLGGNNDMPCADVTALDDTLDGTGAPASGDGSAAGVVRWGGCL
jgi:internalin A